jgi:hypothetical protein
MKRWIAFMVSASMVVLACGDEPRRSKKHDNDGGGGTGTGQGGTSGPGGSTTSGPTSGPGGGGSCTPGGQACQAFDDCCSGVCDNQVCTFCAGNGDSCADDSCCLGLTCYPGDFTCGSCKLEGDTCNLASDCCSNVCDMGFCGLPTCDFADCESCSTSACAQQLCPNEWQTCQQTPDCPPFIACASGCAGNQTCLNNCANMYPDGFEAAFYYQQCVTCTAGVCNEECGCGGA